MRPDPKRVLAVTGPRSNRVDVRRFQSAASRTSFELLETPALADFSRQLGTGFDCVLLFGGDGTLNRYLSELLRSQVPLLPVPTGSGNDFARANDIGNAAEALAVFDQWLAGACNVIATDIGSLLTSDVNGTPRQKYFSCCVNVGLDADAAARANRLPLWLKARGGYFLGGLGAIASFHPQTYGMTIDGQSSKTELWFIALLNTPTYGGGLKIAPHATITDRKLELVTCDPIPRWKLFHHIPKLLTGKRIREVRHLTYRTIDSLRVETGSPQPVYADGEFMGFTPIEVSLARESLQVLRRKSV